MNQFMVLDRLPPNSSIFPAPPQADFVFRCVCKQIDLAKQTCVTGLASDLMALVMVFYHFSVNFSNPECCLFCHDLPCRYIPYHNSRSITCCNIPCGFIPCRNRDIPYHNRTWYNLPCRNSICCKIPRHNIYIYMYI